MARVKTLTHEQVDIELKAAIEAELKKGARPEDLRIFWNGNEWRWSPVLRRWDVYSQEIAKPVTMGDE